jgi:FecR-like protein/TonB-dependent receptor-like protein/tetratricopeptide repeat protein
MKPRLFSGPVVLLILIGWEAFICSPPAHGQAAGAAGEIRIIDAQGTVEISPSGLARWLPTQKGASVRVGDRLRTGPNSRLGLRLSDSSVAEFGEITEIEVLPPKPQAGLQIFRGIMSFFDRDKPGRIRIITRGAAAGVEGTEFVVQVDIVDNVERTTLSVIDGIVRFGNEQGERVLTNKQQAFALPGQAPVPTAGFVVNNLLQWAFYYPAVLNLDELPLAPDEEQALAKSIADYRAGELLAALANYPAGRQPASPAERIYYAALLLSVGQAAKAEPILLEVGRGVPAEPSSRLTRLSAALLHLIAAVKQDSPVLRLADTPSPLSSELLAASYYEQSLGRGDESLERALNLARQSVTIAPNFAFGWARVAELEFSFGRTRKALEALERSLELAPRNPQALALKGFLLAAQNKTSEAIKYFDQAIAIDASLGNAWLGRGLTRIRRGDLKGGREDLLVAAAAEPQRSVLRSYLGKAYAEEDRGPLGLGILVRRGVPAEPRLAEHELALAKELDYADPTAWLYSALLKQEQNRINEAIDDLERSKELNDNRLLYRSRLLLDQDQAVRSANLARIYADAGMGEVAVREAARSVAADYANYSAHWFLANSYEQLRRANYYDLRYETANVNEYLLANLMGPADGRLLAGPVSQQNYGPLFQRDYFGFSSYTEYLSRGAWTEMAVQYGTFGNTSYALEGDYIWDPGQNPNRQFEQKIGSASFKQMLTPKDGLYVEAFYLAQDAEDIGDRYDPNATFQGVHTRNKHEPGLLAGLDHQWNEANRTLFLATHINDSLQHSHPHGSTYLLPHIFAVTLPFVQTDLTQQYEDRITLDSFELQHLNRVSKLQTIAGIRYQDSTHRVSNIQTLNTENASNFKLWFGQDGTVITNQSLRLHGLRISPYIYEHLELADSFWLIGGISYDYQEQPRNLLFAPLTDEQDYKVQFSPKAGVVWTPSAHSAVRAAYTRSLGGVSLDQSVRLEPSQIAGFMQGYRDVIPASVVGGIDASRVETADLSLEHRFPTRTYLALAGQFLRSAVEHDVGVWDRNITTSGPGIQTEEELRYQERSLDASAHQLLGDWFTAGIRYRLSEARLKRTFPDIDPALAGANNNRSRGLLHTLSIQNLFRHPSGFFAGAEAVWWSQDLGARLSNLEEDDFWQGNVFLGYRSPRRYLDITVGILNVTDQDYRIHPINLYAELPRERTFFARLRLNF